MFNTNKLHNQFHWYGFFHLLTCCLQREGYNRKHILLEYCISFVTCITIYSNIWQTHCPRLCNRTAKHLPRRTAIAWNNRAKHHSTAACPYFLPPHQKDRQKIHYFSIHWLYLYKLPCLHLSFSFLETIYIYIYTGNPTNSRMRSFSLVRYTHGSLHSNQH